MIVSAVIDTTVDRDGQITSREGWSRDSPRVGLRILLVFESSSMRSLTPIKITLGRGTPDGSPVRSLMNQPLPRDAISRS